MRSSLTACIENGSTPRVRSVGTRVLRKRVAGLRFEQVFHFVYADGAQMLTVGGGLVGAKIRESLAGVSE